MHFDKKCGCTQGLLLADYLKALVTGQSLPGDLEAQASGSSLYKSATSPALAPYATAYGNAFSPGAGSATAVATTPATGIVAPTTPATGTGTTPTTGTGTGTGTGTTGTGANAPGLPTPAFQPLPPLPTVSSNIATQLVQSPDFGLSMFVWGQPNTTARDLSMATSARFRWQKTLFQWRLIEGAAKGKYDWTEADRVVKASQQAGIKIIARIDFQPAWARKDGANNGPPDNYQDYWDFISAFATRYKPGSNFGQVDAIEVWNEVNLTKEWGGKAINREQAADYVRLLTGAYRVAHTANPSIVIVSAGLSPTGVQTESARDDAEYLQWLYDAGLKGGVNFDALGAHGNTQAPEVEVPLNSLPTFPHESFYFRRVEQLREIMVKNGDAARQIWLLEFGWTADKVNPNYAWFAVTEEKKAQNILKAYEYAKKNWTPWIGVMTLWTLADPTWNEKREEFWWAITNPDGTPRPAFTAIKNARAAGQI
jgi:polysaccharide biosynthesis protein PslG